jgi:hypothetical protein
MILCISLVVTDSEFVSADSPVENLPLFLLIVENILNRYTPLSSSLKLNSDFALGRK